MSDLQAYVDGLEDAEHRAVAAGFHDFGEVSGAVVRDLVALAGFGAQHPREVARLFAAQLRHAVLHRIHEESPPCHDLL